MDLPCMKFRSQTEPVKWDDRLCLMFFTKERSFVCLAREVVGEALGRMDRADCDTIVEKSTSVGEAFLVENGRITSSIPANDAADKVPFESLLE